MYKRRYGLIHTLAPLHVGASVGEEAGNLNLIFRDAYTQTGIIPGSSIRGRFRAEMRRLDPTREKDHTNYWYGYQGLAAHEEREDEQQEASDVATEAIEPRFSEGRVKFEYASLLWIPVFCPGQPVVWVSCPRLLRRHGRHLGMNTENLAAIGGLANVCSRELQGPATQDQESSQVKLFFNLGFLGLTRASEDKQELLERFVPSAISDDVSVKHLVVVDDASMGSIHDMALYRQSRVKLRDDAKLVQFFFNVEALPEGSVLSFPIAENGSDSADEVHGSWVPFKNANQETENSGELYFGGLESIGFGRCQVNIMEFGA